MLVLCAKTVAQSTVTDTSYYNISNKSLRLIQYKYEKLTAAIDKKTKKMLAGMEAQEFGLQRKLQDIDTLKAQEIFNGTKARFEQLQAGLQTPVNPNITNPLKDYLPGLDSLQTAFRFLTQTGISQDKLAQIQGITAQLQQLQDKLQKANDIQTFLKERAKQLQDHLGKYAFNHQLLGMNKQLYYYQQQIAGYKELLHDPQKLEQAILTGLNKIPAFQQFFQHNSYLSQLFGVPAGYGSEQSVAGLQTRAQVQQAISQRIGQSLPGVTGGNNAQGFMQQQMQGVQGQLSQMQNNVTNLADINGTGSGNSNMVMPDFKPNNQKTKPFFKRLEYNFNIQSTKATHLAPSYSDLALTIGYKLNDRASAGAGISYKLGVGRPLNHIRFSNEGAGFRSYIDIKAKGSFWVSGGMEYNYLQTFSKLNELDKNISAWQKSALLGLTKKYKIGKTKQGNIQLLYDFLYKQHVPVSQALVFRMGYSL